MEKAEVYAALGMDPAEQPEVADPAAAGSEGANEQPVTEAAAEEVADESADRSGTDGEDRPVMSKAERAEQARLRRQREQEAAVQAAVEAERRRGEQELAQILSEAGLTNRYRGGEQIRSAEDFRQWHADAKAQQRKQRLKAGELTQEDLQAAIDESPAMAQVRELSAQLQKQQQQTDRQEFNKQVERELAEIRQMDPSVGSLQDILNGPKGKEFVELVNEKNLSFLEAFKLANYERLVGVQQQAARIGAARAAHSKDHLTSYGANSGEGVRVPTKTRDFYRLMMPEMTDEQIRRDYAKRHSK